MKQAINLTTGNLSDAVAEALRGDYAVSALPRLTVDWNLNRYSSPTAVNTPDDQDEGFDIEMFPIESIVEPLRPNKGMLKARVGEAVVASTYQNPKEPKFYVGDEADIYKYWTSPYRTNSSGNFPLHSDGLTTARPRVDYPEILKVNKIVIKIDNTWATPENYSVHIKTTVGGSYGSAIAGPSPAMNTTTGELILYYNGVAWVTNRPANLVTTNVAGIELRVSSLTGGVTKEGVPMTYKKRQNGHSSWAPAIDTTGANSSLNIIAIEPHFEQDLTDRLISAEDSFEMSETSQLYPIGTITSNTATVSLSNEDGIFNEENTDSPYYGLLEANVNFNLEYIYTIDGTQYAVQELNMYSNQWASSSGVTTIDLEDESKYLKEIKPRRVFYRSKDVTEIIWRLLDSIGFGNYEVSAEDTVIEHKIPFFWTTGEETVWQVLDQLAQASQTAIYFDADGKLQVRTRDAAFKNTAPVWTVLGQNRGDQLADLLEGGLDVTNEYEANSIDIKYKSTKWKVGTSGKPALTAVWEPDEEILVVRSSPIIRDVLSDSDHIFINQKEVELWPYISKVQIDGEVIQYDGKQFIYYTGPNGATKNWAIVRSSDDFDRHNRKTPAEYRSKNYYTGGLKIAEREVWNTEKRNHVINVSGWDTKGYVNGNHWKGMTGFSHNRSESIVNINTPSTMNDANDVFWVNRNIAGLPSTGFKMQGTRIRFNNDSAATTQRAGIGFRQNNSEQGYYVEVTLTNKISGADDRKSRGEVTIYSRKGVKWEMLDKGQPVAIAPGIWYDLDVQINSGSNDRIKAWLNGTLLAQGVTSASTKQEESGKVSMYARGKTNVSFEYFYGINNVHEPADDFGYYDLQYGGVRGNLFQREHVWEILSRRKKIKKRRWRKERYRRNRFLFDEFSPFMHEVREFNVEFEPNPVEYSRLFSTNEWYAATLEYNADGFGARFIVANMSRNHAILKGEDRLTYGGATAGIDQVFAVLGRNLEVAEEESVIKENEAAIRARGKIEVELVSDWIQSKEMAEDVGEWMVTHWSEGIDEVTVEIFGNPLLEIGDVVAVDYERQSMYPDSHKYFVTAASNSFGTGITTRLTLRRVRPGTL